MIKYGLACIASIVWNGSNINVKFTRNPCSCSFNARLCPRSASSVPTWSGLLSSFLFPLRSWVTFCGVTAPVWGTLITTRYLENISLNFSASSRILLKSCSKGLFSSTLMSHPGPSTLPISAITSSRFLYLFPTLAFGLLINKS